MWAAGQVLAGSAAVLGLVVALAAFCMCVQAGWGPLAFIPGTFIGAASFSGTGTLFWSTVTSLVVGVLLAHASEVLGDVVERGLGARRRPQAAQRRSLPDDPFPGRVWPGTRPGHTGTCGAAARSLGGSSGRPHP